MVNTGSTQSHIQEEDLNLAKCSTAYNRSGLVWCSQKSQTHGTMCSPWRAVNPATSLLSCSLIIVISCFIGRLVGLLQDNWAGQGRALWSWSRNWWIFLAPGDKLLPPAVSWGYCLSSRNVHPPLLETRAQKYKEKLSCNSYLILHHRAKECFGLEGTFKSPLDNLPVINRDTLHQTMFLRALPNLNICQRLQKC